MNGRAATVDKLIDTPAEKFYRIQPKTLIFDALRSMSIFSPLGSRTSAAPWISSVYVVDKKNCGGWRLAGWEAKVHTHHYEICGETYSRFVFGLRV